MNRRSDGELRWFEVTGEAVYQDGRCVRIGGAVADVTEQVAAARALEEARDLALEASRHKSAFLATMNHEIRTPHERSDRDDRVALGHRNRRRAA